MNIYRQSQGQANRLSSDITNEYKLRRNSYNQITSCAFFALKSKQSRIHMHSFMDLSTFYTKFMMSPMNLIRSGDIRTVCGAQLCTANCYQSVIRFNHIHPIPYYL